MKFSEKVKYVRSELLITQVELAKMLGVSFPTINRWESGRLMPTFLNEKKFEKFCIEHNINLEGKNV